MRNHNFVIFLCGLFLFIVAFALIYWQPLAGRTLLASAGAAVTSDASSSPPSISDALTGLQNQQQSLVNSIQSLQAQIALLNTKAQFARTLKRGDTGDDVTQLQTLLAQVLAISSSTPSNYYGRVTEKQVGDFQDSVGLKRTGVFDSATRDQLAEALSNQQTSDATSALGVTSDFTSITDPTQSITDLQSQVGGLSTNVSDLQNSITTLEGEISDLQNQVASLTNDVSNVQNAQAAASKISLPAVVISAVTAGATRNTASTIWTTSTPTTSEVDYSTNSAMTANQTHAVTDATLVTNHLLTINGLSSGTTYYYRVISVDASGTSGLSNVQSFTTAH